MDWWPLAHMAAIAATVIAVTVIPIALCRPSIVNLAT
jgi:hypothetical protein